MCGGRSTSVSIHNVLKWNTRAKARCRPTESGHGCNLFNPLILQYVMVKLELQKSQEVLEQRVVRGCSIHVADFKITTLESMDSIISRAGDKGFARVSSVSGSNYLVNINSVAVFIEKMILVLTATETKWNGNYGSLCDCNPTGRAYTSYFNLGSSNEYEIVKGTRSGGGIEVKEVAGIDSRSVSLCKLPPFVLD